MKSKLFLILSTAVLICSCNPIKNNNSGFSYKLIPVKQTEWGYIDNQGSTKIPFNYKMAYPFSEGLALVVDEDGKAGYINEYGTYIIKPQYKSGTYFSDGQAFVIGDEGYPKCIDKKGNVLFDLKEATTVLAYSEGLAGVYINGKMGFVNKDGKMIINPQFDVADNFHEGRAAVALTEDGEKKYGYIDKEGKIVIPYQYSFVTGFSEGKALAVNGLDAHCIKEDGKDAFPADKSSYDYVGTYNEGYAPAIQGNKIKYVDKDGKIQIDAGQNNGRPFYGGLAAVSKEGKWGYIDTKGKEVINCQFDEASQFYGDFAVVESNGKYGLIDKKGVYAVQPKYSDVFCRYDMTGQEDLKAENMVYSEYVLPEEVANNLLGDGDKEQISGMDGSQSLKDILLKIQHHKISANSINILMDSTTRPLGAAAMLMSTQYEFNGEVVNAKGFILNDELFPVEITYVISLPRDGMKTASTIKNILANKFSAQLMTDNYNTDPHYEEYHLRTSVADYVAIYSEKAMVLKQRFLKR